MEALTAIRTDLSSFSFDAPADGHVVGMSVWPSSADGYISNQQDGNIVSAGKGAWFLFAGANKFSVQYPIVRGDKVYVFPTVLGAGGYSVFQLIFSAEISPVLK